MTKKLPDKPSELITLALKDLRAVERSKKYVVKMNYWHYPIRYGRCQVCFAGAVMAKTLKVPIGANSYPDDMEFNCDKLNALDYFRLGCVQQGLSFMGIKVDINE